MVGRVLVDCVWVAVIFSLYVMCDLNFVVFDMSM